MTSNIGISPGPAAPVPAVGGALLRSQFPDNQREYDIQHGLVDIVAHTMTIGTPVPGPPAAEYRS
jgi:hypothetical protein